LTDKLPDSCLDQLFGAALRSRSPRFDFDEMAQIL
jgi:hypothetical protein